MGRGQWPGRPMKLLNRAMVAHTPVLTPPLFQPCHATVCEGEAAPFHSPPPPPFSHFNQVSPLQAVMNLPSPLSALLAAWQTPINELNQCLTRAASGGLGGRGVWAGGLRGDGAEQPQAVCSSQECHSAFTPPRSQKVGVGGSRQVSGLLCNPPQGGAWGQLWAGEEVRGCLL